MEMATIGNVLNCQRACSKDCREDRSIEFLSCCHSKSLSSLGRTRLGRNFPSSGCAPRCSASLGRVSSGKNTARNRERFEQLWRELFSDPSQWWDNRQGKPSCRFPDFKHKRTGEGLWIIDERNPPWVSEGVDSIAQGSSVFSSARKLANFNKSRQYEKTLTLFAQMEKEGMHVDAYIYVHVLNACAASQNLQEGRRIHQQMIDKFCEINLHVSSSLVHMYAKCGSIADAWEVFDEMPRRDVVVFTAMILACAKCGQGMQALKLFEQMQVEDVEPNSFTYVGLLTACSSLSALEEGRRVHEQIIRSGCESVVFVGNSLVDMYAKCGSIDEAWSVFDKIPKRNVVSWTSMLLGAIKCGQWLKALERFEQMQHEGVEPNSITFLGLLNACATVGALEKGRSVHEHIFRSSCASDFNVGNRLVDMYAKCGSIADAQHMFDNLPTRNVVSWNTMIMGYAINGDAKAATATFQEMVRADAEVDEVTFICLLSACSNGGLVKEGMMYFESMTSVYGVSRTLEHYTCVVDLLGRVGQLEKAEEMVKSMPFQPSAAVWASLLNACRAHGNIEMGKRASNQILELDPCIDSGSVQLSNSKATAHGLVRGLIKEPAHCWIEVNNEVHSFVENDWEHPQIMRIHEELVRLDGLINEAGYGPDIRFAVYESEGEKVVAQLCYHSEKLAIAFGLFSTPAGLPLRIVKDMRMCGDCHTAIKAIAKIVGRTITVRDANRFHCFKDGACSCGDFF